MKEIKFRVRCKHNGFVGIAPSSHFSLSLHDTGNMVLVWGSDGLVDEFRCDSIEQYTGIKDKNGVEIYESDIVKVTRQDDCFGGDDYTEINVVEQPEYAELSDIVFDGVDGRDSVKEIEIIGNIYDNPELLEDECLNL